MSIQDRSTASFPDEGHVQGACPLCGRGGFAGWDGQNYADEGYDPEESLEIERIGEYRKVEPIWPLPLI